MDINEFITKNDNNYIIKYKNSLYGLNLNNINKSHIFTLNNKTYINIGFFFNKKIVIDYKKFKALISKTKIIELTDIISKNNEYILLESFYDIIRLYKSKFYEYVNKLLIDKTLLLNAVTKTNIITYLNHDNIKDFINVIKKEIKKIDKAFITIGIRNKNKVFYGEIQTNKLNNIGDKVCISTFTKLSIKPNKKHFKIIFTNDLPYCVLDVNEKHILLPRNIILELITNDTLLAKPKKPQQFKNNKNCIIKSNLYNIKKVSLLSISKNKKHCIVENNLQKISGGGVGVGGLISYNLFEPYFGENTKLKVILLLGEEHMNTTHCKENASTDELYSYINEYDKYILNDDKDIDIFIEHTFLDGVSYYEPTFLMKLISNLKNYIQKNPTNLKIHWTDPDIFYENINFYNDIYLHKELYLVGNTEEVLKYEYEFVHYKYIFPSLFKKIKKQDDLVNIILDNEKIIIQAEKSILRESYNPFIKTFFDNNMNFTDENWFSEGIFWTQRLSMDFYVFFRIIRDTSLFSNEEDNLIIKNVIYQAGDFHTQKIFLMFKQLCINDKKYAINESGTDSIDGKEETECLDFTFKTFLEKTKEPIEEPIEELIKDPIEELIKDPIKGPIKESIEELIKEPIEELIKEPIEELIKEPIEELIKRIKNFIIQFDKNIKCDYLDNKKYNIPNITTIKYFKQIQLELININIYFINEITRYIEESIKITTYIYEFSIEYYNLILIQQLINTFYIILCYHSLHTKKIDLIILVLNKFIENKNAYDNIIGFLKILNKFIKLNINKNEDFKNNCQKLTPLLQKLQLIYKENEINTKIFLFEKMQHQQIKRLQKIYIEDSDSVIVKYLSTAQNEIKRRIKLLYYDNNYIKKIMRHLNIETAEDSTLSVEQY
jgi:hypothetical protein